MASDPIKVTFNGKALRDSGSAKDFTEDLTNALNRAVSAAVEEESKNLTNKIIRSFNSQSLPLARLNSEYKKRKIKDGFDPRIGFYTGEMVKAIKFYKDNPNKFFIGIRKQRPSGRKRKGSSGAPIPQYARYFEFGTKKQPARPVFMPLMAAHRPKFERLIKKNVKEALADIKRIWGA